MQPFFVHHFHHAHDLLGHVVAHLGYALSWLV
jgi:hypothetical protein